MANSSSLVVAVEVPVRRVRSHGTLHQRDGAALFIAAVLRLPRSYPSAVILQGMLKNIY